MELIEHTLIAVSIQMILGYFTKNWWVGAALPSGYFIGREVGQAEYRWIEDFGEGLRAHMPWHAIFDLRVWQSIDQVLDWAGPVAVCTCLAVWADLNRKRAFVTTSDID